MVDVAVQPNSVARAGGARKRSSLRTALKRKSTAAFLMTLPLILLISLLVIYPAFYSLHLATLNKPFLIATAALAFFLADTLPVAAIISMTSPTKLIVGWSEMALMTFPYFVLSAGLACIVAMGFQAIGWMAGIATLGVMLGVYRCFQFYFQNVRALANAGTPVRRAAEAD